LLGLSAWVKSQDVDHLVVSDPCDVQRYRHAGHPYLLFGRVIEGEQHPGALIQAGSVG